MKSIHVSDHAVLRYLERVHLMDVEEIRTGMIDLKTQENMLFLGDGRYPIGGGYQALVQGGVVVTIIDRGKGVSHVIGEV